MRRVARELGVDLTKLKGSGEKGRVTKDDVLSFLKGPSAAPAVAAPSGGMGIPEIPAVDFSKFGPIETRQLPRIKKLSGPHLHRAWLNVPHVTHNDESDITEIDAYRKELDGAAKDKGYRVTLLAFLMKAAVSALREFPEFNSSLSPEKDSLIVKKYYHIGIAADTPEGLVVPVIRDVDRKGIHELSQELGSASKRARDGKLSSGRHAGGVLHDLQPGRHRRHQLHADRQRARGGDPGRGALQDGAGVERHGVRAPADAAGVAVLRPPGDRRRARRPLLPASLPRAGGCPPAGPVRSADAHPNHTLESCPMSMIEIRIPDIGDFKDVPIIEVHVKPGAKVAVEDPLLTLESDKATLEVPCPQAGTIGEVKVKTGDRVSRGRPDRPAGGRGRGRHPAQGDGCGRTPPPRPATARRATARRREPTRRSRSRSPTSATSRTCR